MESTEVITPDITESEKNITGCRQESCAYAPEFEQPNDNPMIKLHDLYMF